MSPHLALMIAAAALSAGCSSSYWLRGTVRMARVCATDGAEGAPVVGATVRVICPGRPALSATADAEGRVTVELDEALPARCRVDVLGPDHAPWSIAVADACAWPASDGCAGLSVSARLMPRAAGDGR